VNVTIRRARHSRERWRAYATFRRQWLTLSHTADTKK
jgi:hypothetical protein